MHQSFQADRALGYQQLTIDATTPATLTVPAGTVKALIKCETQAIRVRDDGTAPSATVGYPVATGVEFVYTGPFAALKIIGQVASAVVNVLYYGS